MCGIAGYISNNENASHKNVVKNMLHSTLHRGPDDTQLIYGDRYSFGVNRLAIENIKYGKQPIETDRYIAGFNGEIFNYKNLIQKFKLDNTEKTTEISMICDLFSIFGTNLVNLLEGQFAIFIYDKISEKTFFFRDLFGIRPLHFYNNKNELIFCSEIKGIFASKKVKKILSPKGLAQTCLFWTCVGQQTAFEKVVQLPAGHYAVWNGSKLSLTKYRKNLFSFKNKKYSILDELRDRKSVV